MFTEVINKIKTLLTISFGEVDTWFDVNMALLHYQPINRGWNIRKVLEHISLTNHFLLILIKKGTLKAISKAAKEDYVAQLRDYDLGCDKLMMIGEHQSFYWSRPAHMEPTGITDLNDIRNILQDQLQACLQYLEQLRNGEGVLYKTMMSVNGLGKIDVYQYILFVALHAKRHVTQMEKLKNEFEQVN